MADEKSTIMADETDEQIADGLTGDKDGWTLDELINQMCPDGVEYVALATLFSTRNGYTPSKKIYEYWHGNTVIPWFRMEDLRQGNRIYNDSVQHVTPEAIKGGKLFPANSFIISTTATIGEYALITTDFLANQRFTILTVNREYQDKTDLHYLFYCMEIVKQYCLSHIHISGFASVDMEGFRKVQVPVPPLDVQCRIAHILDLLSELTSELTSEREARQLQYEWYRNHLLDKNTLTGGEGGGWQSLADLIEAQCPDGVEYKALWSITTWDKKFNRVAKEKQPSVNPHKYLLAKELDDIEDSSGDVKLLTTSTSIRFTTEEKAGDYLKTGEIVYIPWGGHANIQYYNGRYVTSDNRIAISSNPEVLNTRFLYHCLLAQQDTLESFYRGSALKHPDMEKVLDLMVPVPPLDVQLLIVDLLDKLDDYAVRIDGVLPREITASQQRYEWWRDRLLDFRDVRGG